MAHDTIQEIQIDFWDVRRSVKDNAGFRCCFVAVGVFTQLCHGVPMKDKKPSESTRAMTDVSNTIVLCNTYTMIMEVHGIAQTLSS